MRSVREVSIWPGVGVAIILLALIPAVGLAFLAVTEARHVAETSEQLQTLEATTDELDGKLNELELDDEQLAGVDATFNDLAQEIERQRADADSHGIGIALGLAAVSITTVAGAALATRWVVRPLADLAATAEDLRIGNTVDEVEIRGPGEVRTVARILNEAVTNLRQAETQAIALADGRLDEISAHEPAAGSIGESLTTAVERLRLTLGEREEYRRRLAHEASHDALTGISNRSASLDHLNGALARAARVETDVAVFFVDLDDFKQVNDSFGHAAGDALLQEISKRLVDSCRDGDMVGRIGGDEFLVIAEPVNGEEEARMLAQRLLNLVSAPFRMGDLEVMPGASVGAALAGGRTKSSDVIHDADLAVYEAKEGGRGRAAFCDAEMRARLLSEADLDTAIRRGLTNGEFELHFQPTYHLSTGVLDGAEALLRWNRANEGTVSPARFIEFAERSDLISEIDTWVTQRAVAHLARWQQDPVLRHLKLAVNVSGRHLMRGDLSDNLLSAIKATGADPRMLTVEVTESALLDDFVTAGDHLKRLRHRGVTVAIDDFGTGYTSLAHLRRLPVDVLKVDRTFTSNLHRPDDLSLVKLVIETGHLLGLEVTVEGVEHFQQEDILRRLGADRLQGYRFGYPMSELDLRNHVMAVTRKIAART